MLVSDADPFLVKEHRAAVADLDRQRDNEQQGRRENNHQQRTEEIGGGLGDQLGTGESRLLDVQQREARDWTDMDSRTRDISEAGRQRHGDSQPLQGPGEPTDLLVTEGFGWGDCDDVGAGGLESAEDVVQTANDGESVLNGMLAFRRMRGSRNA